MQECSKHRGCEGSSGNFSSIATMMNMADGCIDVYSGNDDQIVPLLSMAARA